MQMSLKILILLVTTAMAVSPVLGVEPGPDQVAVKSRVLGGADALAFDSAATREQVAIWEHMASAYTGFLEANEVDAAARKEAFGLLLVRSSTADVESRFPELKELTVDQAKSLIAQYEVAPKPVTIRSAEQDGADQPAAAE